jgi:dihydroorotate dehydrogenase (NAD+) catalytic subunit
MVYQTAQAVSVPIIGMGGIASAEDAIEMILAGATAVSIGTANFADPKVCERVVAGIEGYMERYQVKDIRELVGAVHDR